MPTLRLLASSFVASAIVLPAIGQSHPATPSPAPLAATITAPSIFTLTPTPSPSATTLNTVPPRTFILRVPRNATITIGQPFTISRDTENYLKLHQGELADRAKEDTALKSRLQREMTAKSNAPCATLRTYNFTARDLKSPHPRASSETDCTPITSAHLKELNVPITQPAAIVSPAIQGTTTFATPK